jgi:nitrogen-specific signal transduction histidine kinase
VVDDGPGIEPADLPRIFDPFYTRRHGGSGLGLSIAHRAVQAHGGALIAHATPGAGATFAMVLPRRSVRGRVPPDPDRASSFGANSKQRSETETRTDERAHT